MVLVQEAEKSRSPLTTGLIGLFGGFFLGVMGAFVLEYIAKLRLDPAAVKKLSDAWKGLRD